MEFIFHRSYCGPVKAVVLDWAGTAVDYGSFAPTAVFLRLFESRGVTISAESARSGMGLMKKDHLRKILSQPAVAADWERVHGAAAGDSGIDDLYNAFIPMQVSVLKEYADPIPGCQGLMAALRQRGIKVGSTTGYIRSMMEVLAPEAARRGYAPESIVCPDEVPAGRPYPWMCYQNASRLGVYPLEAMIKIGDTIPDIEEGLNAGMWTIGLAITGNLMGLSQADVQALPAGELDCRRKKISTQLYSAGAHFVVDGIGDCLPVIEEIGARLARSEKP